MSNKNDVDVRVYKAGLGLALVVAGAFGVGWWRSRSAQPDKHKPCTPLEESVYRGFRYRIGQCQLGEGHGFLAVLPTQEVGFVNITADEGALLATLESARTWVQRTIDGKLGPEITATFVGSIP